MDPLTKKDRSLKNSVQVVKRLVVLEELTEALLLEVFVSVYVTPCGWIRFSSVVYD
jgi:hypothetical protein